MIYLLISRFLEALKQPPPAPAWSDAERLNDPGLLPLTVFEQHDHDWKGPRAPRELPKIDTIVLHQTAIEFGVSTRQIKAAGGDRRKAYHKRFEATPYHVITCRNGDILWNNPFRRYTYHGNGSNATSIGFCVEGKYPGTVLPAEQARKALIWTVDKAHDLGCPISKIRAHRQYTPKPNDPGKEIWDAVAVPVAGAMGLTIDWDFKTKNSKGQWGKDLREWLR